MYMAHWICRKSQFSIRFVMARPFSKPCRSTLFTSMIWISFIVTSSSLDPATPSISTLGRMHTGGTGRCVKIRCSGRSATSSSSQSAGEILRNTPSARMGFRSSCTRPRLARSCSLCFAASSNSPMYCSMSSGFLLYFSCTIFSDAPARFTTPFAAPQCGHDRHRLHFSASFLERARRGTISSRGDRNRRRYCCFSSSDTMTREHVLHTCCRIAMTFLK